VHVDVDEEEAEEEEGCRSTTRGVVGWEGDDADAGSQGGEKLGGTWGRRGGLGLGLG